ncbi:hypothetical protein R1T40_11075 [Tritonibacter scottomollicae]|uniref:Pentapeptide repeat protein n=1 Tax=Tritonibacter scottomollicae TaxID=483013 RepID=A0ABZ0HAQ9_TRISK|nr:hypothetical protein [Tritonibacter scottomollicae]WOI31512.1 hypothetical protein R1T40_11075 [Tritonibacter scottomollicae]
MRFQSWDEIEEYGDGPTIAERKLKAAAEVGEFCELGPDDQIPTEPADWDNLNTEHEAKHIRAEVLSWVLESQNTPANKKQLVAIDGAYVSGSLNVAGSNIQYELQLYGCRFQEEIFCQGSTWQRSVTFQACSLAGLFARAASFNRGLSITQAEVTGTKHSSIDLENAKIFGNLTINNTAFGETVALSGMSVSGQLIASESKFRSSNDFALRAQSLTIERDFILDNTYFQGDASLDRLVLRGKFQCIGTQFSASNFFALSMQSAKLTDGWSFRPKKVEGVVALNAAHVENFQDAPDDFPSTGIFLRDGFTYTRLFGPTDAKTRLAWLAKGDCWDDVFYPQPYKQLASVLDDMGHELAAQAIRITLACKLRQNSRLQLKVVPNGDLSTGLHSIWCDICRLTLGAKDSISLVLTAHGYKPQRSLYALILLFAAATFPAQWAWDEGSFAPNSGPILLSEGWQELARDDSIQNPAAEWTNRNAIPGKDWETFNRYAYAADVVIPIVEFGQTDAWAPSTERGTWGYHLWYWRWIFTTLGWIVTALGAAALTGIIRRD